MDSNNLEVTSRRSDVWSATIFAALVVCALGIWFLSASARNEIDELATANSENSQWPLVQAEVELLRLQLALETATPDAPEALDEVRRWFDVFYSRVKVLSQSPGLIALREDPESGAAIDRIESFLDRFIILIDGSDEVLWQNLPEFQQAARGLHGDIRTTALSGLAAYRSMSMNAREDVSGALRDLGLVIVLLFMVLLGVVLVLYRAHDMLRRRAEENQITQSRLSAVATSSLDGIVVVNRAGRILEDNGAARCMFGLTQDESIGAKLGDFLFNDPDNGMNTSGLAQFLKTGDASLIDHGLVRMQGRHKSGRLFPVELSLSTARSHDGDIVVIYIRDISGRLEAERELVEARDKALAGEKAKSEFLAIMSHEMRTPLNGLLGSMQILEETALNAKQKKYMEAMNISGRMLLEHVNTVLDVSRPDSGFAETDPVPFDPLRVVRETADSLAGRAKDRGNHISTAEVGDTVGVVLGDETRFRQVLINLIGNAVKFTQNGQITIEAERLREGDLVEIRVIDTGIGIPPEEIERVFEDFVTLDTAFNRDVEGTGLGLGIVRRLVKMMGGEVGVESEPGEGSAFFLRMPLPLADLREQDLPVVEAAVVPEEKARDCRVLLVEDNDINRLVARELLTVRGCNVTEARDGTEGVELAESRAFDIILMDISMPGLDGVEATRRIRGGSGPNREVSIIALTAHAMPEDVRKFRQAGVDDVIVKPLDRERLSQIIGECRRKRCGLPDIVDDMPASQGDVKEELVEVMGAEDARAVTERALAEIREGLGEMLDEAGRDDWAGSVRDKAHKLAGLAAVVGQKGLHSDLVAVENAANANKCDAARAGLKRAAMTLETAD